MGTMPKTLALHVAGLQNSATSVNNCGITEQTMFATILSQSGKVVTTS